MTASRRPTPTPLAPSERDTIATEMERALQRHVMDSWFPRCLDHERGGFFCDFDRRWALAGRQDRMLEFQGRHTRAAARLALAYPADGRWAEYALQGFRYLRDQMWDHQHGGWFWLIDRHGTPLAGATKHGHSVSYAVQACAVVYAATGDREALNLAHAGFDWFDSRAHDSEYGGYHAWLTREGSVIRSAADVPPGVQPADPLDHDIALKDVNVLGDWFEALLEWTAVDDYALARERLRELGGIYLDHATTAAGEVHFAFHDDWTTVPQLERYGFGFQAAHRFATASARPDALPGMEARAVALTRHTARDAWAGKQGGFWFAGASGMPTTMEGSTLTVRRRSWWVQFEGLRTLAILATGGRDDAPRYAELLRRHWAFVRDRMTDPHFGGVYTSYPGDLRPWQRPAGRWSSLRALPKGHRWKDASHETDALLHVIGLLRGGQAAPGARAPLWPFV